MLHGLLPLYPEAVKTTLLDSRVRNLEPAKANANRFGWQGAQFPFESAYSGYEVTDYDAGAQLEVHVTGDVGWSAQQYLQLTGYATSRMYAYTVCICTYGIYLGNINTYCTCTVHAIERSSGGEANWI